MFRVHVLLEIDHRRKMNAALFACCAFWIGMNRYYVLLEVIFSNVFLSASINPATMPFIGVPRSYVLLAATFSSVFLSASINPATMLSVCNVIIVVVIIM